MYFWICLSYFISYVHKAVLLIWILPRFLKKNWDFLKEKNASYFSSHTSVKDLQAPGEASSPQKRAFSTSKYNFFHFSFLWAIFAFLDPDPQTELNPDPVFHN